MSRSGPAILVLLAAATLAPAAAPPPAPLHWSFRSPKRPAVPRLSANRAIANPVDAFLAARLDAAGLRFSAPADRATLLRRLSFDLAGLPPRPTAAGSGRRHQDHRP